MSLVMVGFAGDAVHGQDGARHPPRHGETLYHRPSRYWYSGTVVQSYSGPVVRWYSVPEVQGIVGESYSGAMVQLYSRTVAQ
jgi:hypothetical protein